MNSFQVHGEFKLTDQFSAVAQKIGQQGEQLASKMQVLREKLTMMRNVFAGFAAGLIASGARLDLRHIFHNAIDVTVAEREFKDMFERTTGAAKIGFKRLHNEIERLAREGNLNPTDMLHPISETLLSNVKLGGRNLLRAIRAGVDIAREKGQGSQEELSTLYSQLNKMMLNPEMPGRIPKQLGLAVKGLSNKKLLKKLKGMGAEAGQAFWLGLIEQKFKGLRKQDNLESHVRQFESSKAELKEQLSSLAGQVFLDPIKDLNKWAKELNNTLKSNTPAARQLRTTLSDLKAVIVSISHGFQTLIPLVGKFTMAFMLARFLGPWGLLLSFLFKLGDILDKIPGKWKTTEVMATVAGIAMVGAAAIALGPLGALVAAMGLIADNWEALTKKIDSWTGIPDSVIKTFHTLAEILSVINTILTPIHSIMSSKMVTGAISKGTNKAWEMAGVGPEHGTLLRSKPVEDKIKQGASNAWDALSTIASQIKSAITGSKPPEGTINIQVSDPGGVVGKTSAVGTGVKLNVGHNLSGSFGD